MECRHRYLDGNGATSKARVPLISIGVQGEVGTTLFPQFPATPLSLDGMTTMPLSIPTGKAIMIVFGSDPTADQAEAVSRARASISPATRDVIRVLDPNTLTPTDKNTYFKDGTRSVAVVYGQLCEALTDAQSIVYIFVDHAFLAAEANL